jgi:deazaflavin-dependent oxidoreductase (nitroreductase family)
MSRAKTTDALLGRVTAWVLYRLVWLGLTPSRWPRTSCGTVILEVKGRRSGRRQSTLVTCAEYAGSRYLVVMPAAEPQWVKNMRADDGRVALRHGRRRTDVVLREVSPDERAPILQTWYRTTSASSPPRRHFGLGRHATIEDFERLAASHAVFRCLNPPTAPPSPPAPPRGRTPPSPPS